MPNPRLEYLFSLQTGQTINPAEREELLSLIDDPANDADLRELIARTIEATGAITPLPDEASRAILLTILQTVRLQPAGETLVVPMYYPKQTRRWTRYVAAAAVLFLAASATWWGLHRSPNLMPVQNIVAGHDLAPGGNKAVLTLADGSHITLDSAHTGVVARQGAGQVVKKADGQIAYTPAGTAGPVLYNTMTTPRGGQYQLTLADGTQVWLNAASSITYPTTFSGPDRTVTISGEAYFEVAHRERQPFRVKAGETLIEDLGTHFNINAYADEPAIRTTLLEGSVQVSIAGSAAAVTLKPGQQARSHTIGPIKVLSGVDLDETLAWKNGLFQFDRADIQAVMRQIARWYDVEVQYEGPVPNDKFWGKLPRDANASQVLRVLQKEQVHFRIEGKKIIVTK